MDVLLLILAGLCIVFAFVGSVVPAMPGPPIGYVGILLMHFTDGIDYSVMFLLVWAGIIILVTVMDNVLPMMTTKWLGGSKWAMWGSVVGLIVGMFVPPIGIIVGTLLGAIIGELLSGKNFVESLKAGFGAFLGFILTTGAKLICCGFLLYYYVRDLVGLAFSS